MGRGVGVVYIHIAIQFTDSVVELPLDGRGVEGPILAIQQPIVDIVGLICQAHGLEHPAPEVGEFGPAVEVLVIAFHGAHEAKRAFGIPMLGFDADFADQARVIERVLRLVVLHTRIRFERLLVAFEGLVDLAQQKRGAAGGGPIGDPFEASFEFEGGLLPRAATHMQLPEHQAQLALPLSR